MTHEEAIGVYFKNNRKSRKTIERLMKWNPNQTVLENAIRINSSKQVASGLKRMYKLKARTNTRKKSVFENGKWTFKEVKVWTKESRQRKQSCGASIAATDKPLPYRQEGTSMSAGVSGATV